MSEERYLPMVIDQPIKYVVQKDAVEVLNNAFERTYDMIKTAYIAACAAKLSFIAVNLVVVRNLPRKKKKKMKKFFSKQIKELEKLIKNLERILLYFSFLFNETRALKCEL